MGCVRLLQVRHNTCDRCAVLSSYRRDELVEGEFVEVESRAMCLVEEVVCKLPIEALLLPEIVTGVVFALECLQAGDQAFLFALVGARRKLISHEIGLDNVRRRREDVGHQILALDDAMIDGAVDFQFIQCVERPNAVKKKSGSEHHYQTEKPMR